MSKVINSPSKRYPGTVTLAYPLTFPQYAAWRRALDSLPEGIGQVGEITSDIEASRLILPGVFAIVERWNLANMPEPLTLENFPSTPRMAVFRLLTEIVAEISAMVNEDDDAPFPQPAPLTDMPTMAEIPQ